MLTTAIINKELANKNFDLFEEMSGDIFQFCLATMTEPPMYWEDVEDLLSTMDAMEVFHLGRNSNICYGDDIFQFDGYGNLKSYPTMLTFFRNEISTQDFVDFVNETNSEFGVDI